MDLPQVIRFLSAAQAASKRAMLVTVCGVKGSSMRNPGTIMGVAEDGTFAGSLSGGCIENAVVSEALDVLRGGTPRLVLMGAGSMFTSMLIAGFLVGYFLDQVFDTTPIFLMACGVLGFIGGIQKVHKLSSKLDNIPAKEEAKELDVK